MNRSCDDRVSLRMMDLHPNCLSLAVNIFGYIIQVLAIVVTIVNILVVIIFMKPQIRSHTTIILTLIACADMVGIVCPAGVFVYQYTFGYYRELLTCRETECVYIFGEIFADMFNMFSLWLTVLLAFIRCRCIKYPFVGRKVHSKGRIAVYVIGISILVSIVHVPSFFIFNFQSVEVVDPKTNSTEIVCGVLETEGILLKSCSRRKVHVLMETLLDSIVPCVCLVYYNFVMLFTLREAKQSRSSLRKNDSSIRLEFSKNDKSTLQENNESREILHFEMANMDDLNKDSISENNMNGRSASRRGNVDTKSSSIAPNRKVESDKMCPLCAKFPFCFQKQRLYTTKGGASTSSDPTLDKLDKESRRTSWLILVVSSVIAVHEIPLAVVNTYTLASHTHKPLPLTINGCFSVVQTLWQFITYPMIFLISACMSKSFRVELLNTFKIKTTGIENHPTLSVKRQSFVSPCLVRKLTARDESIFAGPSQDKHSYNDDVFDTTKDENEKCKFEIST